MGQTPTRSLCLIQINPSPFDSRATSDSQTRNGSSAQIIESQADNTALVARLPPTRPEAIRRPRAAVGRPQNDRAFFGAASSAAFNGANRDNQCRSALPSIVINNDFARSEPLAR